MGFCGTRDGNGCTSRVAGCFFRSCVVRIVRQSGAAERCTRARLLPFVRAFRQPGAPRGPVARIGLRGNGREQDANRLEIDVARKKTFREKLADDKDFPRIQPLTGAMKRRFGSGTILLPAVSEVAELMGRIPKDKVTTINELREFLARRRGASMACAIVTGIEARIVAGAAGEDEADGKKRVVPYWRTLKSKGELNEKYPGGVEEQRRRLESEGLIVIARGKRFYVSEFEDHLSALT